MISIPKKKVAKTVLLPGVLPRFKELFGNGFEYIAYLVANVYGMVRILPANHAYLSPNARGTYNIRQAIAEAARHIKYKKSNIDQIIIFFSIIAALFILAFQIVLALVAFFVSTANAQTMPTTIEDFFQPNNAEEDLAYRLLDMTFGIPDFFNSKENVPTALHTALQSLFEVYSFGMLIVGAMIIIYFIVMVVGETARTGTPFGQRFNHTWAPVRVILFFALIIPVSNGLNGAQYLTLTMAKLGSNLATTGWTIVNDTIASADTETLLGDREHMVAVPKTAELNHLPPKMMVSKTCQIAYARAYNEEELPLAGWRQGVQAWVVYPVTEESEDGETAVVHKSDMMKDKTFHDITAETNGQNFEVVFGVKDEEYTEHAGNVRPVCGKMIMFVTDISQPGTEVIQTAYYEIVQEIWDGASGISQRMTEYAENFARRRDGIEDVVDVDLPDAEFRDDWSEYLESKLQGDDGIIMRAVQAQRDAGEWEMPEHIRDYGWAGAGIWYNKLAEQNGALVAALHGTPVDILAPEVMERVRDAKEREDVSPDTDTIYTFSFSAGGGGVSFDFPWEENIAHTLNEVFTFWRMEDAKENLTGNFFIDTVNLILGTQGLFEICDNTDIHPLAQLSVVGKSMLESSVTMFVGSIGSGVAALFPGFTSSMFQAASSTFGTFASIGLMVGFILFYVIPFMPFMYFFFAVGSWAKTIFEAMVAMPLWALAHLRIDSEGVPGDAAMGGYFLLFEIFIRPILIIFGLMGAIAIFAGMVKVLNEVFYLASSNLSGNDPRSVCFGGETLSDSYRGPIDEFFFTVVYTIMIYLIGNSCFKLIDMVPKQILRWMGSDTASFIDEQGDPASGLITYISLGGSQLGGQLGSGLSGLGQGLGQTVQQWRS